MTSKASEKPASAPSHIFLVRHGARLDMADSLWAHSSPTPYDTPLTYSGWVQSRKIGVRIAALLQEDLRSNKPPSQSQSYSPRKNTPPPRIVLHTSPFLRCVQTSMSIASGIAQHHHETVSSALTVNNSTAAVAAEKIQKFVKPILRFDAWLGEWMTPDYYTEISPPPISQLMVKDAKAEYLRSTSTSIIGSRDTPPHGSSFDLQNTLPPSVTGGFVPPSPKYAASPNSSIPTGFVSHAMAYVELDHEWDSTKMGQGAELGEEWGTMHKRFRHGYDRLIRWYMNENDAAVSQVRNARSTDNPLPRMLYPSPDPSSTSSTSSASFSDEHDESVDTAVILVTHGAGCNALIGAITGKPVLIDIGIGSLTMGVLQSTTPKLDLPFKYDLKIVASTDHMRPGSGIERINTPPLLASMGTYMLTTSGISGKNLASAINRPQRSATTSGDRPTMLWTMPRPEDRERPTVTLKEPIKEKEAVIIEPPVLLERSGATLEGGQEDVKSLWAAKAWQRSTPMRRRWTIGREGASGGDCDSGALGEIE